MAAACSSESNLALQVLTSALNLSSKLNYSEVLFQLKWTAFQSSLWSQICSMQTCGSPHSGCGCLPSSLVQLVADLLVHDTEEVHIAVCCSVWSFVLHKVVFEPSFQFVPLSHDGKLQNCKWKITNEHVQHEWTNLSKTSMAIAPNEISWKCNKLTIIIICEENV